MPVPVVANPERASAWFAFEPQQGPRRGRDAVERPDGDARDRPGSPDPRV